MLREAIDLDLIVKLTGLSPERIQNLQSVDEDDEQILVKDFIELSKSALNRIWLNPQEDEAWKGL